MNAEETKISTHEAYSDESNYNHPEFAAVALVSLEKKFIKTFSFDLGSIISESGVRELKWKKIASARDRLCANKIIDYVLEKYNLIPFRIDVLIWDMRERKKRYPEKDLLILKKMYHQLFKNVLIMRWPPGAKWKLFPDEHSAIDWDESKKILENVSSRIKIKKSEEGGLMFESLDKFHIMNIGEVDSKDNPLCQLADLFCGLGAFSYIGKDIINLNPNQQNLNGQGVILSNAEKERISVLNYFRERCRKKEFNISLSGGFRTLDPSEKINFWSFKFKDYNNQSLAKYLR